MLFLGALPHFILKRHQTDVRIWAQKFNIFKRGARSLSSLFQVFILYSCWVSKRHEVSGPYFLIFKNNIFLKWVENILFVNSSPSQFPFWVLVKCFIKWSWGLDSKAKSLVTFPHQLSITNAAVLVQVIHNKVTLVRLHACSFWHFYKIHYHGQLPVLLVLTSFSAPL